MRAALVLAVLSLLDAAFTLVWLQRHPGGEGNPAMAWLVLAVGPQWFVAIKTVIVGACGGILAHYNYDRVLNAALVGYGLLVGVHLGLYIGGV